MGVTSKRQLPMSPLLRALDQRNFAVYETIVDAQDRKELDTMLGYMLPLMMTGATNNADHARLVVRFNRLVNNIYGQLKEHPELRAKLLACVGTGKEVAHTHFKPAQRVVLYPKITAMLVTLYPDIRQEEVVLWCRKNSERELKILAGQFGMDDDEIKGIIAEYKKIAVERM